MRSFRTEIENPVVAKDIIELEQKIREFKEGKVDEEKFRSLRLARGVYGQRQPGVQMIRIKLPYGKVLSNQLHRISDVSDKYSRGRLHITTRQDIQIHYVDLDRTPELWAELEKDEVTLREACGNTVRNVTASETAGIDVDEPFDVSPYADATFKFFLRNPICQEMGRKFKISFSGTDDDTALSYMHDLGFIAKIKNGERGFKVMLAGGLGSQPRHADLLYDFLATDKIIPLIEGVLRVFDRYGERRSRGKARMKFLLKDIGVDAFRELVNAEQKALSAHSVTFDVENYPISQPADVETPVVQIENPAAFEAWKQTNVIAQKQKGYVAIGIKVLLGDFYTDQARKLADLVKDYAAGELRLSLRQNILIPFVKQDLIPYFYNQLKEMGLSDPGYNRLVDITACPGTDTCNLGIASSTGIARELESIIKNEYPQYLDNPDVIIKISGCMNACGQHNLAHIGFQGMTVRTKDKRIAPALQVLLGGGTIGDGVGAFAAKVLKVPSKRGPQALRLILDDYEANGKGRPFLTYYNEQGEDYFYQFLKELTDVTNLTDEDFIDWGTSEKYIKAIGLGECAGVVIDLISTLLYECDEKIENAMSAIENKQVSNAIYHAYSSMINAAKALLIADDVKTNTQAGIVKQFDELFVDTGKITFDKPFAEVVYQLQNKVPSQEFASNYLNDATVVLQKVKTFRNKDIAENSTL